MTFRHEYRRASNDLRQVTTNRGRFCGCRSAASHSSYSPVRRLSVPDNECSSSFLKLNPSKPQSSQGVKKKGSEIYANFITKITRTSSDKVLIGF